MSFAVLHKQAEEVRKIMNNFMILLEEKKAELEDEQVDNEQDREDDSEIDEVDNEQEIDVLREQLLDMESIINGFDEVIEALK